ncbi:hypothetical protein OEA41_004403 [Lepraria neglecta]|uniref:Uncharacterized protein n=1 Tax=Lepraria neglecta TaxID=209136 RepID=A0AAD9Z086_9LECA|nr:hypothetical protein OEA41_004403 [Lepraria neglecta]
MTIVREDTCIQAAIFAPESVPSENNDLSQTLSLISNNIQSQAILNINSDSNAYSTSPIESTEAFRNVTRWLDSSDEDAAFWWQMTGPLLGLLLSEASYDLHSQYQALLSCNRFVVTALGRRPASNGTHRIWKSYMTDDHSPIEFSWNWRDSTKPPRIRCTIEAIPSEIDSIDPSNQEECVKLIRQLRVTLPNNDWQLFDYFANAFRLRAKSTAEAVAQADNRGYRSSMFLGFEFEKDRIVIKAYFAPVVETGDSVWKAIVRSVKALEHGQIEFLALLELDSFLAVSHEGIQLNVEGLAIDYVPLRKSRLKIYARSSLTSFDSVRTYMTMGSVGTIPHSANLRSHVIRAWRPFLDKTP